MIRTTNHKSAMIFLAVFLLLLLGAREAFSAGLSGDFSPEKAGPSPLSGEDPFPLTKAPQKKNPPPLKTLAARNQVTGVAQAGERFRVVDRYTFPTGERFARVEKKNGASWLQLAEGQDPRVGEDLTVREATYLFREPVAEADDGRADEITQLEFGEEEVDVDLGGLGLTSRHPLNPRALGLNGACTNFIRPDGNFGAWGGYLMSRINRRDHANFFDEGLGDLASVCPRFRGMNDDEKKNFWVWLIASMANFESSCNPRVKARGVNGTAAGLLQLHLGREHNYGCRRGIDALNPRNNLECGLTMLNNDLGRTSRIFPSRGNYWQVLRPHTSAGARTLRVVRKYGPCF